jgi:hypothetical protein
LRFSGAAIWNSDAELVGEWRSSLRRLDQEFLFEPDAAEYELSVSSRDGVWGLKPHVVRDASDRLVGEIHGSKLFDQEGTLVGVWRKVGRRRRSSALIVDGEKLAAIEREPQDLQLGAASHVRTVWQLRMTAPLPRTLHALAIASVLYEQHRSTFADG